MYKCFFSFCSIDNLLLSKSLKDFNEYEGGLYIQPTIVLNFDLRSFLSISTNIELVLPPMLKSALTLYC